MKAIAVLSVLVMASMTLPAQRMELGDRSGRQVAVFDVSDVLDVDQQQKGPALRLAAGNGKIGRPERTPIDELLVLLRLGMQTGDGNAAELQALGTRHVVALGTPMQIAATETFLAAARQRRDRVWDLEVQVHQMDEVTFTNAKILTGKDPMVILDAAALKALMETIAGLAGDRLELPRVSMRSLRATSIASLEQIHYIKDFTLRSVAGAEVAEPVIEVLEVGMQIDATSVCTKDGEVLLDLAFREQSAKKPLGVATTKLPGIEQELTFQVPWLTGCKVDLQATLAFGSTAVLTAQRSDKRWVLVLVTARQG
jgi:hypothetical protein